MPPAPRVLRRALLGFLTRPTAILDEVPEALRPARRAVLLMGAPQGAPPGDHQEPRGKLRLLSYNLQRAGREAAMVRTLLATIRDHAPDVLLLQEAPRGLWRHPELAPVFAGRDLFYAPFHQVSRTSGRYKHPEYGQLIASRLPLLDTEVIELPTVTRAGLGRGHLLKRIALLAEIRLVPSPLADRRRLRLVNVHHEPFVWPRGRRPQHETLLTRLPVQRGAVDVCAGDFNATFGVQREPGLAPWWRRGFEAALQHGRCLDNALARGHRTLRATRLRLPGSDHRPLLVEVGIGGDPR